MLVSPELELALKNSGVNPEDYAPAYTRESAGLDLYNAGPAYEIRPAMSPNAICMTEQQIANGQLVQIPKMLETWDQIEKSERDACCKCLIPTGLRLALPSGWVALIRGRGSVSKTPLLYRAGVIDPGYTGEIWVNAINVGPVPYTIEAGAKLPFQIIVVPFASAFEATTDEKFQEYVENAKRRSGQLGSSD